MLKRAIEMTKRDSDSPLPAHKRISIKQTPEEEAYAHNYFQPHVLTREHAATLKQQVQDSEPYRWGTIKNLIDDSLLRQVRKEIMDQIEFTKKETDIYKVYQSGDLANLSAMPKDLLMKLPSIYKLRSAIYSQTFRDFVSEVTGAGKLSGIKTDLSLQLYTKGCHLLTHDDVIGSRRVSFILYMPDPDAHWKDHYGGSLQLLDSIVPNVPQSDIHSKLTPQFNQIAFFEVQPGKSFHAVEEVSVDRQRLSLQGWFHIPQRGEPDFVEGEQERTEAKSTLHQLESKELRDYDFPKQILSSTPDIAQDHLELTSNDVAYLSTFMNPSLLTKQSIDQLSQIFNDESVVDVLSFLNPSYETSLRAKMKRTELNEYPSMPQRQSEVAFPWKLAIPAHKWRYLYIDGTLAQDISSAESIADVNSRPAGNVSFDQIKSLVKTYQIPGETLDINPNSMHINSLTEDLCDLAHMFKSVSFLKWIYQVTKLELVKDQVLVRRFRPGMDFILATKGDSEEGDDGDLLAGMLESTLNLTPTTGWENGENGGYELCLMDDDEEEPSEDGGDQLNEDEAAIYKVASTDSVLYEGQTGWNRFNLMFRDKNVLKFVKYVSNEAPGSRWDIVTNWKCKDGEEDET